MADRVINICFHGIGSPKRELEPGEHAYWISEDTFHRVLDEVATWPSTRLSFDDGNASDVEIGLPALQARRLTASFFLIAGRLGTPGSVDSATVRDLCSAGMIVGTHGMSHRPWRRLPPHEHAAELIEARDVLATTAGRPIEEAALPLGRYDRRLLADLRRLGYSRVYSSDRRKARADSWLQPRFSVRTHDTPESLRRSALSDPSAPSRLKLSAAGLAKRLR